ncbi:hypothetical protein GCM10010103_75360 [Streptomyces paradoxus]
MRTQRDNAWAAAVRPETQEAPDLSGASHLCALGRIRTGNLLIRRIGQGVVLDDDSL